MRDLNCFAWQRSGVRERDCRDLRHTLTTDEALPSEQSYHSQATAKEIDARQYGVKRTIRCFTTGSSRVLPGSVMSVRPAN